MRAICFVCLLWGNPEAVAAAAAATAAAATAAVAAAAAAAGLLTLGAATGREADACLLGHQLDLEFCGVNVFANVLGAHVGQHGICS